jgi:hypothetical protein
LPEKEKRGERGRTKQEKKRIVEDGREEEGTAVKEQKKQRQTECCLVLEFRQKSQAQA